MNHDPRHKMTADRGPGHTTTDADAGGHKRRTRAFVEQCRGCGNLLYPDGYVRLDYGCSACMLMCRVVNTYKLSGGQAADETCETVEYRPDNCPCDTRA